MLNLTFIVWYFFLQWSGEEVGKRGRGGIWDKKGSKMYYVHVPTPPPHKECKYALQTCTKNRMKKVKLSNYYISLSEQ